MRYGTCDDRRRPRVAFSALAVLCCIAMLHPGLTMAQGETPTFDNSSPEAPLGRSAGEPSLGVAHFPAGPIEGRVMYIAGTETLRVTYDECTSPPTALWEDVSAFITSQQTLDPILFTDPVTGRTFVSQLAGKTSLMAFTDDEGVTWEQSQGAGINSGVDHQTVGGGPYPAGDPGSINAYPHAVYYCSQDIATAQCALSRDGGVTFGPAVPIYAINECGGLHGHIKVAPDGTAYVPNPGCTPGTDPLAEDNPAVVRSTDAGVTWEVKRVETAHSIGGSDPAVGIAADGTLYFGFEDNGAAAVAVSHDRGDSWARIRDVSSAAGVRYIVFPQVTAGDPDRAAIAFLGTDYAGPGNPEGDDPTLPAVWHLYIAATYDAGDTWATVNATPGDPVQRGTICGAGVSCGITRNLLDFNDVTIDREGRILAAYADGCIGGCVNGPPNSRTDIAKIARQVAGRRMIAAFDPSGTEAPAAVRLDAFFRPDGIDLEWAAPDDRGTPITGYNVYRRDDGGSQFLLNSLGPEARSYADLTTAEGTSYLYEVTAVNAIGEGDRCREVAPRIRPGGNPCVLPGVLLVEDGEDGAPPALEIESLSIAEPFNGGADQFTFTLKVADLGPALQPGNAWIILWNRPIPDADFDRNFVAMRATGPLTADFTYGKITPPSENVGVEMGAADAGTFSFDDDTITITISADKVDGTAAGQDLNAIEVRTFVANVNNQPVTQLTSSDFTASAFYTRAGNNACSPTPVAQDDFASTPGDQPVDVDVLANDFDPDGDPLQIVGITDLPAHGSATINPDNTVHYAPDVDFAGTDTFAYAIQDPGGLGDTATVTVEVFRAAPFQQPIADDAPADQVDGVDQDGRYVVSWTFPGAPDKQPCGFVVEEASTFDSQFFDDAEEALVAGSNTRWTADPQWVSAAHPDTGTLGYSVVYLDELDVRLTMNQAVQLPAGPSPTRLVFDSFEDIEDDFDYALVELSADGGPFQLLTSATGAFSGTREINLSDFAGQAIRLRFRFQSDQLVSAPLFLGWSIDNVDVQAARFEPIATLDGAAAELAIADRPSGTYYYRVAGLFGAECDEAGPYSNVRSITVDREQEPEPVAPVAEFTATPNPATVNESIVFDGSQSQDQDSVGCTPSTANNGCITRYFWSFGDGQTADTTDPQTTHSYAAAGTYRVLLTVTDNDGQTASIEHLVTVDDGPSPSGGKVTGGGWITVDGAKSNFGFNAEQTLTGEIAGHLNYHDKQGHTMVSSDGLSTLTIDGDTATFGGTCSVNKQNGFSCTVEVEDQGEPGTGDRFTIRLSNGYEASGVLGGGNVQIH